MKEHQDIISGENSYLNWSVAQLPMSGESVSGDSYLVRYYGNQTLVAVSDGLGHGEEALNASQRAFQYLETFSGQSLISLVQLCHKQLRETRGVVMNLALFDNAEQSLTWMGIGNIEGMLFRAGEHENEKVDNILLRGGVVGYKLPMLRASMMSVSPGDTLVFTTDGVSIDYEQVVDASWTPELIAGHIASRYFKPSDDALVLAACYKGGKR
ncbi:MAG: SpoIIE family protein phosphatase [Balneolaceae bacterium]